MYDEKRFQSRASELQRLVDLSIDDARRDQFIGRVKRAANDVGVKPQDVAVMNVIPSVVPPPDDNLHHMMEMFTAMMASVHQPPSGTAGAMPAPPMERFDELKQDWI